MQSQNVSVRQSTNPRVCAIKVTNYRPFIVMSVYMPTDKLCNLPELTDSLEAVSSIIQNNDIASVYMHGDYNAHPHETFNKELVSFCSDNSLVCVDINILCIDSGSCTFIREAHGSRRWLDH